MEVFKIGGFTIVGASDEAKNVFQSRDVFINKYCAEKGWDKENLSFPQILEIRDQDGWKNAGQKS